MAGLGLFVTTITSPVSTFTQSTTPNTLVDIVILEEAVIESDPEGTFISTKQFGFFTSVSTLSASSSISSSTLVTALQTTTTIVASSRSSQHSSASTTLFPPAASSSSSPDSTSSGNALSLPLGLGLGLGIPLLVCLLAIFFLLGRRSSVSHNNSYNDNNRNEGWRSWMPKILNRNRNQGGSTPRPPLYASVRQLTARTFGKEGATMNEEERRSDPEDGERESLPPLGTELHRRMEEEQNE